MDNKLLRACLAELIGTFALVFVGGGVVCVASLASEPRLDMTAIALAEGLTLAVALTATARVSGGGLNPALTLMLWVFRRIDGRKLLGFVMAQVIGAVLAGLLLRLFFPTGVAETHLGTPHLRAFLDNGSVALPGILSGIGVEVFFTCMLAFAFYATLLDKRSPPLGGLIVGLAQAANLLFGFRLDGAAANPARWLGTVVWEMTLVSKPLEALNDHTVYWVGPILGALLGGFLYVFVMQPPEE
jgi:MIP family channel proteins